MLTGPVTLVLSLRCVCWWAWGPCDPGVYASRPRGLSGQLELHVPRDLILHVCQSPVALVITSQCMCQGAWGLWRTLAVRGPKHWPPWSWTTMIQIYGWPAKLVKMHSQNLLHGILYLTMQCTKLSWPTAQMNKLQTRWYTILNYLKIIFQIQNIIIYIW